MRKLLRSIARANMKAFGVQHMNRKIKLKGDKQGAKSYFARNWREYISKNITQSKRRPAKANA